MKIVHISTATHGGAGIATLRLHLELLANGVESTIISLENVTPNKIPNHIKIPFRNPKFHEKVLNKLGFPITNYHSNIKKLSGLQGDYEIVTFPTTDYRIEKLDILRDADVIHLHWVANFINYPTFFKVVKDKKIVWTLHDLNPIQGIFHYKNDELRNHSFESLNSLAYKQKIKAFQQLRSLTYICLNNWMLGQLTSKVKTLHYSTRVIPNIINESDYFADGKSLQKSKSSLNFLLIADNVNNYRKGFDLALAALDKVKNKDKITLFIVGKGDIPVPKGIKVNIIGAIYDTEKLRNIYNECDYLLLSSREDNLPNTMVEALLCGTAVISFKVGGMADHILNNVNGFAIEPYNVEQVAEQIDYLVDNNLILSRDKISEHAHQAFSQTNIHKYIKLYKDLMNEKLAL